MCMRYAPSRKEISPTNGLDLDERTALEHFDGLDYRQALNLFRENFDYYIDDLHWMGIDAFLYYLKSLNIYLEETDFADIPLDLFLTSKSILMTFEIMFDRGYKEKISINKDACDIRLFIITKLKNICDNYEQLIANDFILPNFRKIDKLRQKWHQLLN